MPYDITFATRGSLVCFSGVISIDDIHNANGVLHGSSEFDQHKYQIGNFLDADLTQITQAEADELSATDWAAGLSVPLMRVALVVREDHATAVCEQYRKMILELGSAWECQLFDSMADARKWVDS